MVSFKKLVLLAVAAGAMASVQAQPSQGDTDRRMRNREDAMLRRQQMDREGGTSAPAVTPAPPHALRDRIHAYRMRHHGHRVHMHRHHAK